MNQEQTDAYLETLKTKEKLEKRIAEGRSPDIVRDLNALAFCNLALELAEDVESILSSFPSRSQRKAA